MNQIHGSHGKQCAMSPPSTITCNRRTSPNIFLLLTGNSYLMVSFYIFSMKWFQIDHAVRDKVTKYFRLSTIPFLKKFQEPEVLTSMTELYLILHFAIYFNSNKSNTKHALISIMRPAILSILKSLLPPVNPLSYNMLLPSSTTNPIA